MTNPELITDEIVAEFAEAYHNSGGDVEMALCAVQDDITRPVYALLNGWKHNSEAYERALRDIRDYLAEKGFSYEEIEAHNMADRALKGDYHKTDFTEYCEQNPITEEE